MGWQKAEKNTDYPEAVGIKYVSGFRFVDIPGKKDSKDAVEIEKQESSSKVEK